MNCRIELNKSYLYADALETFMRDLERNFDSQGELLAANGRNIIKSFDLKVNGCQDEKIVVKYFRLKNIFQKILYSYVVSSKAKRAFDNGLKLIAAGCSTPMPMAYGEIWKRGILQSCYYVTACTMDVSVRTLLEEQFDKPLARAFAKFIARLHEHGLVHHDLNFSNVLYHQDEDGYVISVIDINRMTMMSPARLSLRTCKDDFVRWTDRKDLFEFVIREYAEARGLDIERVLALVSAMKMKHDKAWKRRKRFTGQLKKWVGIKG